MRFEANGHTLELVDLSSAAPPNPPPPATKPVDSAATAPKTAAQEPDIFLLLAKRLREGRSEVKRLRAVEAEVALLEKMAAAAGLNVSDDAT